MSNYRRAFVPGGVTVTVHFTLLHRASCHDDSHRYSFRLKSQTRLRRLARKKNLATSPRQNNATSKSRNAVKAFWRIYSSCSVGQINGLAWRVSPDERGGSRSSRTRGGMRWTQMLRLTSVADAYGESVWFRRPDAGVKLVGSIPPMTVTRKPVHRGERAISRKAIAQGRRNAPTVPVCSCAFSFVHFAHETAGAASTRRSLRPRSGGRIFNGPGFHAAGSYSHVMRS